MSVGLALGVVVVVVVLEGYVKIVIKLSHKFSLIIVVRIAQAGPHPGVTVLSGLVGVILFSRYSLLVVHV